MLQGFYQEISALFGQKDNGNTISLSTVHRAKGLEADRVFILDPSSLPLKWRSMKPWQRDQEDNLKYVALTRSKEDLYFVD